MYALSIKQPWADLIVLGHKTIETRNWNQARIARARFLVGQTIAIHASKTWDKTCGSSFGVRGCVIGIAQLAEIKIYQNLGQFADDRDLHLCGADCNLILKPGQKKIGFVLMDPERCDPVYLKGRPGFWRISTTDRAKIIGLAKPH